MYSIVRTVGTVHVKNHDDFNNLEIGKEHETKNIEIRVIMCLHVNCQEACNQYNSTSSRK